VAAKSKTESGRETTPKSFPEVPPSTYTESVGSAWLMESVMQMQQSVGELKATVGHLTTASDRQATKLDSISHRIYAAGVVLAVLLSIGGFFMNKIWDGVVTIMIAQQNASKFQEPLQSQPSPKADQLPQKP
jgi:hypothetical protein